MRADPGVLPAQVAGVAATRYSSVGARSDDIMVTWQLDERTVKTFEVYYSEGR